MSDSLRRRRGMAAPSYEVVSWSMHWRRVGDRWYRDAVARRSDGELRLVSFPDGVAA